MDGPHVAFIYWGRRGGMCRLTLEAARAAHDNKDQNTFFSISTTNELYPEFRQFAPMILPVDTFRTAADVALKAFSIFSIRRKLIEWLNEHHVKSAVVLMPHVWIPFVAGAIKRCGIHYAVVIHDADPHPGDHTAMVTNWLLHHARGADTVFTLSAWVTDQLIKRQVIPAKRIKTLFMPDVLFPSADHRGTRKRQARQPLRVLFFGRLMRYKGLRLFVEAMEILAAEGTPIEISVCGEGSLDDLAPRLAALGAVVVNRWLSDAEVGVLFHNHDLAVLTHIEASQSGTIAAALGAGVPVVTTPVGGLAEQVHSRGGGLVSAGANAQAIADCVRALALDPTRYNAIVDQMSSGRDFSVARFMRELIACLPSERLHADPTGLRFGDIHP